MRVSIALRRLSRFDRRSGGVVERLRRCEGPGVGEYAMVSVVGFGFTRKGTEITSVLSRNEALQRLSVEQAGGHPGR